MKPNQPKKLAKKEKVEWDFGVMKFIGGLYKGKTDIFDLSSLYGKYGITKIISLEKCPDKYAWHLIGEREDKIEWGEITRRLKDKHHQEIYYKGLDVE